MAITHLDLTKIMVRNLKRMPIKKGDVAVWIIDGPNAATAILDLISQQNKRSHWHIAKQRKCQRR